MVWRCTIRSMVWVFLGMAVASCGRFGYQNDDPGINGKIALGNEIFPSGKARYIVVSVFASADFNVSLGRPKETAKPLAKVQVTGLSTPPYLYDLKTGSLRGVVYLFAYLDQDDSGGDLPTNGDHYGFYSQPLNLQGFRVPVDLVLDKLYQ